MNYLTRLLPLLMFLTLSVQSKDAVLLDCIQKNKIVVDACEDGLCLNFTDIKNEKYLLWYDYVFETDVPSNKLKEMLLAIGNESKTIYKALKELSKECSVEREILLFVKYKFNNEEIVAFRESENHSAIYLMGGSDIGKVRSEIIENILKDNQ
ncbi:hypothetical protein VIBNISFn27_30002 [Vibrio nigripulchritudo SFn27]|uniref:DUF4476 domain-containing protein n=1 Tax=Vibrio nigripulchritudo TaxID=28173 RepID=U4KEX9_9VIBR|nr:hypothetical protein [Vibrio nigripulchritudo]CCN83553.1 hypothetical protein VIBNIBLFn1_640002 [Vibrio nigripulchritudo BLFn1]CCN88271.1 hypothetical protein VIBNISFn27_30002 [Vibrio nigripulchritudo SFn27]CCN93307.1 hypothetical protein VIBNIENn2_120002 [Vibrio nigripulchritudo ENn2]CCO40244.1 hypothetical protein VIBNISFn135_300002 [Vibrio nigripulchritudo SFn135]CCO55873.1 hypothetical protein VIBNIWn13_920002 [Vibrio nigripulchritudo Wn13]